jgi:hypothetical protein
MYSAESANKHGMIEQNTGYETDIEDACPFTWYFFNFMEVLMH